MATILRDIDLFNKKVKCQPNCLIDNVLMLARDQIEKLIKFVEKVNSEGSPLFA